MDFKTAKTERDKLIADFKEVVVDGADVVIGHDPKLQRDGSYGDDPMDDELDVEAFSAGTHRDSKGEEATWTEADIRDIADKYNAAVKTAPAPVVLGHPTSNSPAYGWVKSAKAVGDKLILKLGELNRSFIDALRSGAYKTRSLSLYEDNTIRHLGFLGGMQPAVKGLAPFEFHDGQKYKTFSYEDDTMKNEELTVKLEDATKKLNWYERLFNKFKVDVKDFKEKDDDDDDDDDGDKEHAEKECFGTHDPDDKECKDCKHADSCKAHAKAKSMSCFGKHSEKDKECKECEHAAKCMAEKKTKDHAEPLPTSATDVSVAAKEDGAKESSEAKGTEEITKKAAAVQDDGEQVMGEQKITKKEITKARTEAGEEQTDVAALKAQVDDLMRENAGLKALLEKNKIDLAQVSHRTFCEGLVKKGTLRPADLDAEIENLNNLEFIDANHNFAEGGSAVIRRKEHLQTQPKIVEFGETLPAKDAPVALPAGAGVEEFIDKKIRDKMKLSPNISYAEALQHALAECEAEQPQAYAEYVKKFTQKSY